MEADSGLELRRVVSEIKTFQCSSCLDEINGPSIMLGENLYFHPECFICKCCQTLIAVDERYGIQVCIPYCESCFKALSALSQAAAQAASLRNSQGDVRKIPELPPTNEEPDQQTQQIDKPTQNKDSSIEKDINNKNEDVKEEPSRLENDDSTEIFDDDDLGLREPSGGILELFFEGRCQSPDERNKRVNKMQKRFSHNFVPRQKTFDHTHVLANVSSDGLYDPPVTIKKRPRSKSVGETQAKLLTAAIEKRDIENRERAQIKMFALKDLEWGEKLGEGFFGTVYKVIHKTTGQAMAVKELKSVGNEEANRTFRKEVALLKRMHHPNILQFLGMFRKKSGLVLMTEYVGGGTLRQFIKKKSEEEFSWQVRLKFALEMATGLSYLHSHSVIHRDLTSKNCLIRDDLTLVVSDFGLAKPISKRRKQTMTVCGSPYWMAPEMMRGNDYNYAVDVFSYGIILGEMGARIRATPDEFPRTNDFGVDFQELQKLTSNGCPPFYFSLLKRCCELIVEERPTFKECVLFLTNEMNKSTGHTQRFHSSPGTKPSLDKLTLCSQEANLHEKPMTVLDKMIFLRKKGKKIFDEVDVNSFSDLDLSDIDINTDTDSPLPSNSPLSPFALDQTKSSMF